MKIRNGWSGKEGHIFGAIPSFSILKMGVIAGIFLVCLAMGYLVPGLMKGSTRSILVLLVAAGIPLAVLFIQKPALGLILFIPVSFLVPFSIGTGSASSVNLTMILIILLTGVWMVDVFVLKRRKVEILQPTHLDLLLFMAYAGLSFWFGQVRWYPVDSAPLRAQLGGLGIFLLSGLAYFITALLIDDLRTLKWMVFSFLGLGAVSLASRVFPMFSVLGRFFQEGTSGSLFWIWLVSLSLGQAICNQGLPRFWRICLYVLPIGALVFNLSPSQAGWTSGWLPALLAFTVILFIAKPRWRPYIVVAGFLGGIFEARALNGLVFAGDNTYSLSTRTAAWQILGEIIQVNPIFGLGFANYYWYAPLFPIMGWMVQFNSHNNYVDIVAETGIVGLVILAWFLWQIWRLGWKMQARTLEGFSRGVVIGALGGLIGSLAAGMLGDWFLPFVYNIGFTGFRSSVLGWLFLGSLVAIYRHDHSLSLPDKV